MIPKVELMYNYDYAKQLYRGDRNFEDVWRAIIGLGADFEIIFNEYITYILEAIEKYSGFAWEENAEITFPLYLAQLDKSLVHPLTLAVSSDPKEMLMDMIEKLVNRNMFFGFTDDAEKEKCLRSVTKKILSDLKLDNMSEDEYNLEVKTIKEYLK